MSLSKTLFLVAGISLLMAILTYAMYPYSPAYRYQQELQQEKKRISSLPAEKQETEKNKIFNNYVNCSPENKCLAGSIKSVRIQTFERIFNE